MKGLFVLQRRFLTMGHQLAILLRESGSVQEFCAYIQIRDGFEYLKSQGDIAYTRLLLDEDIFKSAAHTDLDLNYLKSLEGDIGTLWRYMSVDRVVRYGQGVREYPFDTPSYTYEEMLRIVQVMAKNIEKMLDEEKPDFVYMFQPGFLAAYLIYAMAKKRGIAVFLTETLSVKNLVEFSDSFETITSVDTLFQANLNKPPEEIVKYREANEFVETFRNQPASYSAVAHMRHKKGRLEQFAFLRPGNLFRSIYFNFFRIFLVWMKNSEKRSDYSTVNPFLHLYDRSRRKLRNLRSFRDLYDEFDASKQYAYFPLHFEPELSLLMNAPFNADQLEVAKRVARSLPVGMYLYVKEHPDMVPFRSRKFYKQLKKIPNVRLINPSRKGSELIQGAAIVITITGSAGWEGALMGKPVISLGHLYYNSLSSVHYSKTPEELADLIQIAIKKGGCDKEEIIRYVAALFEDGAYSNFMHLWEIEQDIGKKREGLRDMADVLAKKIGRLAK